MPPSPTISGGQKFWKGCQMANRVVHSPDILPKVLHKYISTVSKYFKEFDSFQSWFPELIRVLSIFSCVPVSDTDLRQLYNFQLSCTSKRGVQTGEVEIPWSKYHAIPLILLIPSIPLILVDHCYQVPHFLISIDPLKLIRVAGTLSWTL